MNVRTVVFWLSLATALQVAGTAGAAEYPTRPIRIVVPFGPGGGTDVLARIVAPKLAEFLGQQVLIDNRPGANGIIGGQLVAKAAPDGYTIMLAAAGLFSINQSLYASMPYDSATAFAPITQMSTFAHVLVVPPSLPAKSVKELITYAKANPRKLAMAHSGAGGTIHLSGELFKSMTGVDFVVVPYKSSPLAHVDIIGGQVHLMFDVMQNALPQIKAGKLLGLGVTAGKRSPRLPELPTIAEAGVPGYETVGWSGFAAPTGTPRDVINKLNREIVRVLDLPEVKERWAVLGAEPVGNSPDEFARYIRSEAAKWGKLIKALGLRLE